MFFTLLGRSTALLCAAILAAMGLVVGFAPAALANHNIIRASIECGESAGTWNVRWTLVNNEADKATKVIASSNPSLVPVGTVIEAGGTFTAHEVFTTPRSQVLEVTAQWERGITNTNTGWLNKDKFPQDCGGSDSGDSCAELPGDQSDGFACTMSPTERKVERTNEGCSIGGVRTWTDVYTTTYSFQDGEWVANAETGPVRQDDTFTPYTAQELIELGCGGPSIATTPTIKVVDGCGVADDSVTLSTSDEYTGVDNGDGTATFTAAPGYVFDTADGRVARLTLTYDAPSDAPCVATAAEVTYTPATCDEAGQLVIPRQPLGVSVTPAPGTYGPGTYDVVFTAKSGYTLASNPSGTVLVDDVLTEDCSDNSETPPLPDTGGDGPPKSTPANPVTTASHQSAPGAVLPATGASNGVRGGLMAGMVALLAGMGLMAASRRRAA